MEPVWNPSEIFAMVAEMKAEFETMKIKMEKLEETLANKEKELDNAKETIIRLKQEMKAIVDNRGDDKMSDSISGGNTNEKQTSYYQDQKFRPRWIESELGLYSDSGMESIDVQI